ncbi:MAG TPA: sulfotransferase [Steroidobacteraceae bacterium]|nr:sulfotransferase [Steroidobacteraceae bacterium]
MEPDLRRQRDLLYRRAYEQRQRGEARAALLTLEELERLQPRFSRLFQERGLCHVQLKQAPEAIAALVRAVNLNSALPVSWDMLVGLFRMTRQEQEQRNAEAQVATLATQPPELVTANALFADGDLTEAESLTRSFLARHGHHLEAMRLLARIGVERDAYQDAQLLFEGVLDLEPQYHAARYDYAQLLIKRHLHAPALEQTQRLLQAQPENRAWRTLHAAALVGLGRHEEAIEVYRQLLEGATQPGELHLSIAHSHKTLGRQAAAIDEYRTAAALRGDYGDAWWSLANLKTYRFAPAEIERMAAAEATESTAADDRWHLCFALGKALEDRGDYSGSFDYYRRGNALKRAAGHYRPETIELEGRLLRHECTATFFARHRGEGHRANDPIFIVGLPRSGSTLIEQILASHPQVEGTQELANIPRTAAGLQEEDLPYPLALARLEAAAALRLGAQYIEDTRVYRTNRPRFIDKMPNNFRHVALIHRILPDAVVIDARREPMACCFGNFKQLFAQGQEFTYGMEDIARYYRNYLELMRHWDTVLPGRVLRVHHEDVVEDLEGQVRRILDHCGLPFDPACLQFHRTQRSVRTASSEQVRQPIYRDGLDQWRQFEPWLAPLRDALGDALTRYRD